MLKIIYQSFMTFKQKERVREREKYIVKIRNISRVI